MATVQSVIDSARYDLTDFETGLDFDDVELLNYLNRMVGLLDTTLSSLQSDLVEAEDLSISLVSGQAYVDISGLNSGNWSRIRKVWIGSSQLDQVALNYMRYTRMYRSGNAVPNIWALSNDYILFPQGATAPTELMPNAVDRTFSAASAWADVDLASGSGSYDESGDLSLLAGAAGAADYCTLAVASAPTTVGNKYRMLYDVSGIVESWTVKDFTGAQTIGTISANATQGYLDWTAEYTGGYRLVAAANDAAGSFDNFKLYLRSDNNISIYYDKKNAALALTDSMPYSDRFNEHIRETVVQCAKGKKNDSITKSDSLFNSLFEQRVIQEEIARGFIPKPYTLEF